MKYTVRIDYKYYEKLSSRRIGETNFYNQYEDYRIAVFEQENKIETEYRLVDDNLMAPNIFKPSYFSQFLPIPYKIFRTNRDDNWMISENIDKTKVAQYLSQKVNEKYSDELRSLYEQLQIQVLDTNEIKKYKRAVLNFIKNNKYKNKTEPFEDSFFNTPKHIETASKVFLLRLKGKIVSMCCLSSIDKEIESKIISDGLIEKRYPIDQYFQHYLTLCVTDHNFTNRGFMKTILNFVINNVDITKQSLLAITNDFRLQNLFRFFRFVEIGKPIPSLRKNDNFNPFNCYLLKYGDLDNQYLYDYKIL